MRLTSEQIEKIRGVADAVLGPEARVTLFGSRVDDARRGGDIDLLFETDARVEQRAEVICLLHARLLKALGDRRIDVLLRDANTPPAAVFEVAHRTGVRL
ncbi:MAG: nucleotidyltransferase domain-containing protein [Candidatus Sericytochromatia bacterium]|nr:nucleotidyltransferase domain-containing protein [Candidatus Sericytochromatia bacterium]